MIIYKNILLAIDFYVPNDELVIERGIEIAKMHNAELTLVHALEHPYPLAPDTVYPLIIKSEHEMIVDAQNKLSQLAKKYNIANARQIVQVGPPKSVILELAKKNNIDLIVIGSHGRHGINLILMGSTASAVLNRAECDVLTIRIKNNSDEF